MITSEPGSALRPGRSRRGDGAPRGGAVGEPARGDRRYRGYGQFCPVAKGAEVVAERWTPLVLRDLLDGPRRFADLHRGLPRMSRALLAERLARLEREGLLSRRPATGRGWLYELTPAGDDLRGVVAALGAWGHRWRTRDLAPEERDPDHLMEILQAHAVPEGLPERRAVVEFAFRDAGGRCWWLVVRRPEVSLCRQHPGPDPDVHVVTDTATLTGIYLGHVPFAAAAGDGRLEAFGEPEQLRALPRWLARSRYAA